MSGTSSIPARKPGSPSVAPPVGADPKQTIVGASTLPARSPASPSVPPPVGSPSSAPPAAFPRAVSPNPIAQDDQSRPVPTPYASGPSGPATAPHAYGGPAPVSQPNTAPHSYAPSEIAHANPTQPNAPSSFAPPMQQTAPQASDPSHASGPTQGAPQYIAGGSSGPSQYAVPPRESSVWDVADNLPGSPFVKFLKISARRAFRLRIEPSEVLPAERRTLEAANPPILEASLQAFLAWRRSVLFLVACALVPLTIIGIGDALRHTDYQAIFFVKFAPAFAELIFCMVCWQQLKKWAHWRQQRRKLFWGWLVFMITPFIVFIYPLNTFFSELRGALTSADKRLALAALGIDGIYKQAVMPFVFAMIAMLQLAPKAISLMPGLIRSSMVIKLLFPGVSAPGWLIVMASPLYALLAYVILIIPYQFTGSGWFIAGVLGVVIGQSLLARAGFRLARPMTEAEALVQIKRVRRYYVTVMITSGVLIVVALGSLVAKLNLRATDVILAVLKFETNVLILTMIGTDLVITNLEQARGNTAGKDHVEEEAENKIAAFVSLEGPKSP